MNEATSSLTRAVTETAWASAMQRKAAGHLRAVS